MAKIQITETKTGHLAAIVPIVLHGMNYTPGEIEYFGEAWKIAVEDKLVDAKRKEDYSFKLVPSPSSAPKGSLNPNKIPVDTYTRPQGQKDRPGKLRDGRRGRR
jgi:hypothetical protein